MPTLRLHAPDARDADASRAQLAALILSLVSSLVLMAILAVLIEAAVRP